MFDRITATSDAPGTVWSSPSFSQAPIPCEWASSLDGSETSLSHRTSRSIPIRLAKPSRSDATAGSGLDAVPASWTIVRRGRRTRAAPDTALRGEPS